jgi:hypothetical protein
VTVIAYKLLYENWTSGGHKWVIGEWQANVDDRCAEEFYVYADPVLAIVLNPIYGDILHPLMAAFECENPRFRANEYGLIRHYQRMRAVGEIPAPNVNIIQRLAMGIICARQNMNDLEWLRWAEKWLNGDEESRSFDAVFEAGWRGVITRTASAAKTEQALRAVMSAEINRQRASAVSVGQAMIFAAEAEKDMQMAKRLVAEAVQAAAMEAGGVLDMAALVREACSYEK